MRTTRVINFLLTIFLIGLLIHSGIAAPEINLTRPNVIYRERISYYDNHLIKGNNTGKPVGLLLNSASFGFQNYLVRDDPNITLVSGNLNMAGNVSADYRIRTLHLLSGYQHSDYLPSLPVKERYSTVLTDRTNNGTATLQVNRSFPAKFTFTQLQNSQNFTQITRDLPDLTGFVYRTGVLGATTINNTKGDPLVTVVRFSTLLVFYFFKTSTKELVGVYEQVNHGFGNIFPTNLISYLGNQSYIHQIGDSVSGFAQLQGKDRISWFYTGYNSTYGLDMYSARFQMTQHTQALLFSAGSVSLTLNAVSLGLESFLGALETSNGLSIEDTTVEGFDTAVVDTAIKQEGDAISNPTTTSPITTITSSAPDGTLPATTSSTQPLLSFNDSTFVLGQILALIALGAFMFYKMRK